MAYTTEEVLRIISDEEEVLEEINSSDDDLGMDTDEDECLYTQSTQHTEGNKVASYFQ